MDSASSAPAASAAAAAFARAGARKAAALLAVDDDDDDFSDRGSLARASAARKIALLAEEDVEKTADIDDTDDLTKEIAAELADAFGATEDDLLDESAAADEENDENTDF